ncbi:HAMP domain-containing methyl-accepting chemotaxis protein [Methanosarcina sp.]|uniref:methyl-accepting chemotaxis protein n=1 Tax=Methanosarcina sp. TaxID=2213 RepID=UPI002ABBA471|nr:HAMP domain-containing methyl-accepting chemotaxis protein [Methanosarcina sp.]MDY9925185.1 HAMP domain-containing methyl-accepting chemotaxis protein [Methanosarcina sp.]
MYKSTKIGHVVIGFALLLVLIFFVGYTGYQGMNEVEKKSRAIQNMTFIMNNMQGALQAEESYIIHGDPDYKGKVYYYLDHVPTQAAISKEIYIGYLDPVNRDRMDIVLAASSGFREAFDKYVDADDEQADIRNKLAVNSEILITNADELSRNQMVQYREEFEAGYPNETLEKKFANAESAQQIIVLTMKAQSEYQNYAVSPEQQYADNFDTFMEDIIELSTDLNGRMERPENIVAGKEILTSAENFQADFEQFKILEERKTIEEKNMTAIAARVGEVAAASSADQKGKLDTLIANSINKIFLVTFLSMLVGALLVFVILSIYRKPIYELLEAADMVSEGNLDVDIKGSSRSEISQLSEAFKAMVGNLCSLIKEIQEGSLHLAILSEEMSASSEEVASASRRISETAAEISNGAEVQSTKIIDITHAMQDMTHNIQEVADNTQKVSKSTNLVNDTVHNIGNVSRDVLLKMDLIRFSVDETDVVIKELDSKSQQINEIITVITRIADQTNMLALNAAIEAARAGEHGRGFSVVADEVRKLAEESGSAAKSISRLIDEIRNSIGDTVKSIEASKKNVENGSLSVSEEVEMVTGIVSTINEITNMIEDVAAATEEQSASIEEITSTLEDISSISEQSAAGTQETAAALEEQSASMSELASMANDLSLLGEKMKKATEKFRLGSLKEEPESIIG